MPYISPEALRRLANYSYKGVDRSIVTRYILNPFWNWLITLWPLWVAPNVITLSGLAIVLINFLTLLYYDPYLLAEKGGATGPPHWIYFTWAAGLFIYQSFDAIDGKQARRTGMAGPLGEMFDHGCDAINTTLEAILTARALNLGRSWWTVASQVATLANFYLTTWEEYHTGQLYLGIFSGPVEGILMIVGIFIISGIYGPTIWDTGILTAVHLDHVDFITRHIPNIGLNVTFMVFGSFALAFNIITSYTNVYHSCVSLRKSAIYPLLSLIPFLVTPLLQYAWLLAPNCPIRDSPLLVPFLCAWGLQFAHQVGRMILAHVTSSPFPFCNWLWLWYVLGTLDANLPCIANMNPIVQSSYAGYRSFVYATLAVTFIAYQRFVMLVISEFTNYLGIACFTVRKRDTSGVWKKAAEVNGHVKKT